MSLTLTNYADGSTSSASSLLSRIEDAEKYINEQIATGDLQSATPWVGSELIYPPDFFGDPAPRVEAQSFDVYFRVTRTPEVNRDYNWTIVRPESSPDVFVPVPGLATQVRIEADSTWVTIVASWYAFASECTIGFAGDETVLAATFALFVDGTEITSTQRKVYNGIGVMLFRKQLSIAIATTLDKGIHDVSIQIKVETAAVDSGGAHGIFIYSRNLVVIVDAK